MPTLRPLTVRPCGACHAGWRRVYLIIFATGGSAWLCGVCRLALWRLTT